MAIALKAILGIAILSLSASAVHAANSTVVAWSDSGLHEMDGNDVSVYSLFPPYSTIHAQLMTGGKLVTSETGITVTYEAVADPTGSINTTSHNKGNFYNYALELFGKPLEVDQGLAGFSMPGSSNQPQAMVFNAVRKQFDAIGIPITPYDDQGNRNPYPLLRVVARNASGAILASTTISVPVSDQMDCRSCHASGSPAIARPPTGWTWNCDPDKDYKLNVLKYHDDIRSDSVSYSNALFAAGYNPAGLYATVVRDAKPVLCIRCHSSNALPGTGLPDMRPLTALIHTRHAYVADIVTGVPLVNLTNSASCFVCHAGPEATYLRGAHHNTVGTNGAVVMQCQNCHGSISDVGKTGRQGWLEEPSCQSCHTGIATANNGSIRYTSVFEDTGNVRVAVNSTFAAQSNTPSNGLSLYQYSQGHGGLACAACHGATHAENLSLAANDNVQSTQLQGHAGVLTDCTVCHASTPTSTTGGPHGLHPVGQNWASRHANEGQSRTQCQECHGADYRGTVLSRMEADRTVSAIGTKNFWQGFQIGCYNCHAGPNGGDDGPVVVAPKASNLTAATTSGAPVAIPLKATGANGNALVFRIVHQPAHGTVSLTATTAIYYPASGFTGDDAFTYAAWDGSTDSNLGQAQVSVLEGNCELTVTATAPTAATPGVGAPFRANASLAPCQGNLTYEWDFGDGAPHDTQSDTCHTYVAEGTYLWKLIATDNTQTQTVSGVITISSTLGPPLPLSLKMDGYQLVLSWPSDGIPATLESSQDLSRTNSWLPVWDTPSLDTNTAGSARWSVPLYLLPDPQFFRLRRVP